MLIDLFFLLLPGALIGSLVTSSSPVAPPSFFDAPVRTLDGQEASLAAYQGKTIVVLNVASECGYTPQYADWEAFYKTHGQDIVVLGFPCNDFGAQEPGSAVEIAAFCQKNYGVTFPMFEKVHVKGADKHPVFQWLTDPAKNGWNSQEPNWNFNKYVIDKQGKLVKWFPSKVKPDNPEFLQAVGLK